MLLINDVDILLTSTMPCLPPRVDAASFASDSDWLAWCPFTPFFNLTHGPSLISAVISTPFAISPERRSCAFGALDPVGDRRANSVEMILLVIVDAGRQLYDLDILLALDEFDREGRSDDRARLGREEEFRVIGGTHGGMGFGDRRIDVRGLARDRDRPRERESRQEPQRRQASIDAHFRERAGAARFRRSDRGQHDPYRSGFSDRRSAVVRGGDCPTSSV